ncbi:MAG: diphthamide biosynthesis enzyme Dph2 [Aigarchaeota archaeon]|nr:diphthamide biosynthesis enzyme Dph2 [Aigarchaeota archaeon]MCX8192544.1 diphthamide biosynthesis enzyme Dph2 [Nitrososphaeria archaeon]MDW7985720.1 diphthamide biosynthesis enzyme Dph2 [Nitrososphaerota archaeon]
MYKIEFDQLDQWIENYKIKRVLVQVPLGLRSMIPEVVRHLKTKNVEAIISIDSCWGACDLAYGEAKALAADGLIHMGHARMIKYEEVPTIYLECRVSDPTSLIRVADKVAEVIGEKKVVGLGMTVQWLDTVDLFIEKLKERGIIPLIGSKGPKTPYRGVVVGCDYTCIWSIVDKIDCSLIIGSTFHGLGAALTTSKPVYTIDPELGIVKEMDTEAENLLKCRYAWIEVFKNAKRIGVLISMKIGQRKIGTALRLKKILEAEGKEVDLLSVDELREDLLDNLPYDGYVNTACPRLSLEDQMRFRAPLLLPSEVLLSIGKLKWKNTIYSTKYLLV